MAVTISTVRGCSFLLYSAHIPFQIYFIFEVVKDKVRETIPLRSLSSNTIVENVLGGAAKTIYTGKLMLHALED
jgi:hypothetical protein